MRIPLETGELIYMQSHEVHEWEQNYCRQRQSSGDQEVPHFPVYSIPNAKIKEMIFLKGGLPNIAELHIGIYVQEKRSCPPQGGKRGHVG